MMARLWGLVAGVSLKAWAYIALAFALLGALAKVYFAGKESAQVDTLKNTLDDVEKKNVAEDRVDRATPDERVVLRNKWTRP